MRQRSIKFESREAGGYFFAGNYPPDHPNDAWRAWSMRITKLAQYLIESVVGIERPPSRFLI
jgi:hypothetical protein